MTLMVGRCVIGCATGREGRRYPAAGRTPPGTARHGHWLHPSRPDRGPGDQPALSDSARNDAAGTVARVRSSRSPLAARCSPGLGESTE